MSKFVKYLAFLSVTVISVLTNLQPSYAQTNAQATSKKQTLNSSFTQSAFLSVTPQLISNNLVADKTASDRLADIQNHWANPFITRLVNRNLVERVSESTFHPNKLVTRAEFATILDRAFIYQPVYRQAVEFEDVPANYWAAAAIKKAYAGGFLSGYNSKSFRPNDYVTRVQAMVAIANGLDLIADPARTNRDFLISMYRDADSIPEYAVEKIASLTARQIVVNYPEPRTINSQNEITRAELTALIYQSLVYQGQFPKITSQYIIDPSIPLFNIAAGQITRLEIKLSQRQVTAYQGDKKLKSYPVAVGRAGWETPTGTYKVKQMVRNPAWKNPFTGDVIKSGDPDNPLGKYWIGFWTDGKDWSGFHGTPNRDSVGQAVSHGCIRMYNEDIQDLFSKVTPETIVKVIN